MVGGWSFSESEFTFLSHCQVTRDKFVHNIIRRKSPDRRDRGRLSTTSTVAKKTRKPNGRARDVSNVCMITFFPSVTVLKTPTAVG